MIDGEFLDASRAIEGDNETYWHTFFLHKCYLGALIPSTVWNWEDNHHQCLLREQFKLWSTWLFMSTGQCYSYAYWWVWWDCHIKNHRRYLQPTHSYWDLCPWMVRFHTTLGHRTNLLRISMVRHCGDWRDSYNFELDSCECWKVA